MVTYVQYSFVIALSSLSVVGTVRTTPSNSLCDLPDNTTFLLRGSCNFNNGFCGYNAPPHLWNIHTENFGSIIYGRVKGDYEGDEQRFALFQSNDPNVNDTSVRNSSIVSTEIFTSPVCLKFWYLMPNQNSKLNIYMIQTSDNASVLLFSHEHSPISQWREVKLAIPSSSSFKIEFQSERENSFGYVGVDNVQFVIELPPTTTTVATEPTSPPATTRTTKILTTTKRPTPTTENATFSTATQVETTTHVITTTPITTTTSTTAAPMTEEITTSPTSSQSLPVTMTTTILETTTHSEKLTTDCECHCPTVETVCAESLNKPSTPNPVLTVCDLPSEKLSALDQYSCNFDHGLCGFSLTDYPHLWELTSHHYGDVNVGMITGDHSKESLGRYVVFNTYNNHVQNNTLHHLRSPSLLPFTQYCASFWYNMPNNGSELQVYAEFQNATQTLLWQQSERTTYGWVQAKIPLLEESSFMLVFTSTKKSPVSFLGIDDIQISIEKPIFSIPTGRKRRSLRQIVRLATSVADSSGCSCTCPPYHVINCQTTLKPVPPHEQSCSDLVNAVYMKEGSCDFDHGTACNYDIPVYPHLWDLIKYSYGNTTAGIIDGDTSRDDNGMFLAFVTDNFHVPLGLTGNFRSGTIQDEGKVCLSFWYNLPTGSASISVYKEAGDKSELLWKKENQTSNGWQKATVLFQADMNMKIDFVSTKSNLNAYFGIDDIQLYSNVTI